MSDGDREDGIDGELYADHQHRVRDTGEDAAEDAQDESDPVALGKLESLKEKFEH